VNAFVIVEAVDDWCLSLVS